MIAGRLTFSTDAFVILSALGAAAVTPFAFANRLVDMTRFMLRSTTVTLMPAISASEARGDLHAVRGYFLHGTRLVLYAALPLQAGLLILGKPFLAIWLRLAYWQIVKAEELSAMGQEQYTKNLEIPPKRGDIQTSDGFPLITNKISYLLYANPKLVKDTGKLATAFAPILNTDVASISAKLAINKLWVSLQAKLD